jgi:hypothetical protein
MPSTVIRSYEYCAARCELRVTFQSGRRYVYRDVPAEAYSAMRNSFSKGEFFNAHIRDRYSFIRDEPGMVESTAPLLGSAPIKTPDLTDSPPTLEDDEIPKVGSQDSPGG